MSSRLHTTLVYFGVVRDEKEAARLEAGPVNAWQATAVAVAFVLLGGVAIGVLVLLKASGVSSLLIGLFLVFEIALIARIFTHRRGDE